ncbi:MAG: heterodisulfide reductase-related iron-sulfur binding cluster [Chloroflexota bacterium]
MPTRPIAWNVSEIALGAMYLLMAIQGLALGYAFTRRYLAWREGKPMPRLGDIGARTRAALAVTFLHRRILRRGYVYVGLMHLFIFYGFIVLFLGTIIVLLEADIARPFFGVSFYRGAFYVAYKIVINLFGLLFIVGLLMAGYRRYGQSLPKFRRSLSDDAIVLGLLLFLAVTGFLLQALRLAATQDPNAAIHWVSYPIALALTGVSPAVLQSAHAVTWWSHMLANTSLLVYLPVSKLAHMFTGPTNVFLRAPATSVALPMIANIEEQEHFGAARLADFQWQQLVNLDACMRCGRCLDFCPTFNTGKPLKPRQLIVEMGAYMDRQAGLLAGPAGPRLDEAGVRGSEVLSPDDPTLARVPALANVIGDIVSEEEIWDCTTCRACMEQCPVKIEHVPLIVEMRRNLVLEQSQFPQELVGLFNNLERNGNPYSFPASTRADWARSAGVKELADVEVPGSLDVVYWVGCMSSFDARNQKVATALAKILQAANVSFAILGKEESCSGDPARRAGNEYLYQVLAQTNIERLRQYTPKRVVASCPHCFNTLRNEYPQLGGEFDVVHHTQLIRELIDSGRLTVPAGTLDGKGLAYHDPCYLGRYNGVYDEPRDVMDRVEGGYVELPRCRDKGFCCGAGGARAFMEEKRGTRISHNRLNEAIGTDAQGVAVACPFCVTMFEDGVRALSVEETFAVRDIAEIVADAL